MISHLVMRSCYSYMYLVLLLAIGSTAFGQAGNLPSRPVDRMVVQLSEGPLSSAEISRLDAKMKGYEDSTSTQIAILLVETLHGMDPNQFTQEVGEAWGVGQDGKDNGVMIVVSMGDRKWSLQSGYGVEHALTDGTLGEIGRRVMRPRFRQNQYYTGLDEATTEIMQRLSGEFKPSKSKKAPFWMKLIPLLFIALIAFLIDKLGNRGGGNYTSMHSGRRRTSRHGSPWRSSPGSSSSWGGFGGGSFGGGGASGGW